METFTLLPFSSYRESKMDGRVNETSFWSKLICNEMAHNESLKGKQGNMALNTVPPNAEESCFY